METLPVTLIVKAPNQQIEDQQIKCELSWTIHKLKQHLSEVYPSKPPKHEQKLIYSGQLLNDSVTLKDVLRQYEGQETHTVHLVCTPKHMSRTPPRQQQQQQQQPQLDTTTSQNRPGVTQQPQRPQNMSARTENQPASQRGVPQPQPPHIQNTNAGAPVGGGYAGIPFVNAWGQVPPAGDLNQYAEQMAWMQQAYMQYMTQYMQLAANSYARQPIPNYLQYHGVAAAGPELAAPQQNPAAAAPEQEQPAAAPRVVVAAAVADPDNQQERDWLDIFYVLSRAMVLFSVVYFYSSPLRFVFVLLLGFALYLYHIGFFRNINNNNNNNNTVPADGAAAAGVQQQQEEPQAPSRLMVVWTFFASFFASLIPEIPNAV